MAASSPTDYLLPQRVLTQFRQGNYSPHNPQLTDLICESVGGDLLRESEVLQEAAQAGQLVSERNFTPSGHRFYQDIDFVVGTPSDPQQRSIGTRDAFPSDSVDDVWFALNAESLVSSVRKNWKNRGRDIHSFYLGVYDVAPLAATGGVIVLNVTDIDQNPEEIIAGYHEFDFAEGSLAQSLDSLAIVPIRYESNTPAKAELVTTLLDESYDLHYTTFVETLTDAIERRFQGEFEVSPESIHSVLSRQESDILEFKESVPDHKMNLAKEIAALANHEGGALLLGVADDGSPVGLDDIDSIEERVSGILTNTVTNGVRNVQKSRVGGADILIVNVQRATTAPVDVDGTFYVRTGTTRDRLSGHEILDRFPR